jgi:hypothetical protein
VRRSIVTLAFGAITLVAGGLLFATCTSPGDACRSDGDCGGDLVCAKPEVDGGPAEMGACSHRASGSGGFCRVVDDCADGLFCSNELPSPTKRLDGSCIPLRAEGETCASSDQCGPPLECMLTADESGTCGAPLASDAGTGDAGNDDAGSDNAGSD